MLKLISLEGKENKTIVRYHFIPTTMAIIKKTDKYWWGCEEMGPFYTVGRNVKWCSCFENSPAVPQILNTELLYDPAILLLATYQREMKNICPCNLQWTSREALNVTDKKEERPECPSTDEGISEIRYVIFQREYYSALKNEELIHATIWMRLKNIMLSERSQVQRPDILRFHLYDMSRTGKSKGIESRLMIARSSVGPDAGE